MEESLRDIKVAERRISQKRIERKLRKTTETQGARKTQARARSQGKATTRREREERDGRKVKQS